MDESDVRTVLSGPLCSVITDIFAIAASAPGKIPPGLRDLPKVSGEVREGGESPAFGRSDQEITSFPAGKLEQLIEDF